MSDHRDQGVAKWMDIYEHATFICNNLVMHQTSEENQEVCAVSKMLKEQKLARGLDSRTSCSVPTTDLIKLTICDRSHKDQTTCSFLLLEIKSDIIDPAERHSPKVHNI